MNGEYWLSMVLVFNGIFEIDYLWIQINFVDILKIESGIVKLVCCIKD